MAQLADIAEAQLRLSRLMVREIGEFFRPPVADAIVSRAEVNTRHGTGVLLLKIFGHCRDLVSIRTRPDSHGGGSWLGAARFVLSQGGADRVQVYADLLRSLGGTTIRRVVCVPFSAGELHAAIALKDLFGASLCLYIMDDNNVAKPGVADGLMREALKRADLRLVISPEMRDAYEAKYRLKCWVVPPIVLPEQVRTEPAPPVPIDRPGVLIGNIWSANWLERLRRTVRDAGLRLHWYGNGSNRRFHSLDLAALSGDGIELRGHLSEKQLVPLLQEYPYAVLPTSPAQGEDATDAIARLSLPSRVTFLLATAHLPMIVLGSRDTAVAHCVERLGLGVCVEYAAPELIAAVDRIGREQVTIRRRAAALAPRFSSDGLAEWIWQSLEQGEPIDCRFEDLFPKQPDDGAGFLPPPVPRRVAPEHAEAFRALRRLRDRGWQPDFLIDVGGDTAWSESIRPLLGSCIIHGVQSLAQARGLGGGGRGLLRVASSGPGRTESLEAVKAFLSERTDLDVLILGVALEPASNLRTVLAAMNQRGYCHADDAGLVRDPADGRLLVRDMLFVRRDRFRGA